jgi:hypothetical protein
MMRYGFGIAHLFGAFYYPNLGSYRSEDLPNLWYNEFDVKMGQPTAAPPTIATYYADANGAGVWRRDFVNSLGVTYVLLVGARRGVGNIIDDPIGSGDQTTPYPAIDLGRPHQRIVGAQDPVTNSGATLSSIQIQPRDAVLLKQL